MKTRFLIMNVYCDVPLHDYSTWEHIGNLPCAVRPDDFIEFPVDSLPENVVATNPPKGKDTMTIRVASSKCHLVKHGRGQRFVYTVYLWVPK